MNNSAHAEDIAALRPYLVRVARARMVDRDHAEEVVQDTLATALASAGGFEARSQLRTWVTGILMHKMVDAYRLASRERELRIVPRPPEGEDPDFDAEGAWRAPPQPWCDPEVALRASRFRTAFANALDALPRNQARAFAMRELEGVEPREICRTLGVTEGNLWVLLHRARLALRRALDRDAFAPA